MDISLDGLWQAGSDRRYTFEAPVPGLASDPQKMNSGVLWYRREAQLPAGDWTHATLWLYGARFCPAVYVNGELVSQTPGGMTLTRHLLKSEAVRPGSRIALEIALQSLADMDAADASRIPDADRWRSNISSCLWDRARLRLHGPARWTRLLPCPDLQNDLLTLSWEFERLAPTGTLDLTFQALDDRGRVLVEQCITQAAPRGRTALSLKGACQPWSPEQPRLYRLRALLKEGERLLDTDEISFGLREFRAEGVEFRLNGQPLHWRGGTVVWHRWTRDPEARELAFDADWFERNIVLRLKSHGANGLRFHLGMPPEALLDLCDRYGLLVQAEWSFFHGMKASYESLVAQWRDWLDLCLRHPSICLIHPWNETEGQELETAFAALNTLAPEYPPLVISHRDVIHVHKYWWSLFENLGLYYDSATQFPQPIMADEFGGNYLDGQGNPGSYPTLRETMLRFLGREHTAEMRLQHHTEANTQVAEYWRRVGAAGFSPFCALGAPEDGNHHFLGALREGNPKPVWDGLTAAYSPLSVSLEVWDRNFRPGQRVALPLWFFNDSAQEQTLRADVQVVGESGTLSEQRVEQAVGAHRHARREVTLQLPPQEGHWRLQATLLNPPAEVRRPVVSAWRVRTLTPRVPAKLRGEMIGIAAEEDELRAFLAAHGLPICALADPRAQALLLSWRGWEEIARGGPILGILEAAIARGSRIVLLDLNAPWDADFIQGRYQGPLQGAGRVEEPRTLEVALPFGVRARLRQSPEPESHLHPAEGDDSLWSGLERQATWLWNGLRGGLIVPPSDLELRGLSQAAFLALWRSRGADTVAIQGARYIAYELAGQYAFCTEPDEAVANKLRQRVSFLVEDAPSLQNVINPSAPIRVRDLAEEFRAAATGQAERLTPLASCGKNLLRAPVAQVDFGAGRGRLILSQAITRGRLAEGFGQSGLYGLRRDPAAEQFVLNMLAKG
jgi:hypothetical protein